MFELKGKYSTAKVMIDNVDESCIAQITQFLNHHAFHNPIAIMPDTHAGKGAVIGFTMVMSPHVIPNIIGVDIGCGMLSTKVKMPDDLLLKEIDDSIRKVVPLGTSVHKIIKTDIHTDFPWNDVNKASINFSKRSHVMFLKSVSAMEFNATMFASLCKKVGMGWERAVASIGTLGGGNHFIELGVDTNGETWLTVHSGSRQLGLKIASFWQNVAREKLKEKRDSFFNDKVQYIKMKYPEREIEERIKKAKSLSFLDDNIDLKQKEWLEDVDAHGYLFDMILAQHYAKFNRAVMRNNIVKAFGIQILDEIDTTHNFIDFNDFVIRKGAIRSYENERMIIPFNMRDGMLICEGKSNPEWNYSAPHGAGRVMSRIEAKEKIDMDTFKKQMKDVYSSSVCPGIRDEAPDAYKDPKLIEDTIFPTATVINRVKPVLNIKSAN